MNYRDLMALVGLLAKLAAHGELTATELVELFNGLVAATAMTQHAIEAWAPVELQQRHND